MSFKICHKHGGDITEVTAIGHETRDGVADWFFIGSVAWDDGSRSDGIQISPAALCTDGSEGSMSEIRRMTAALADYLNYAGHWHESRHTRDGRVYTWSPNEATGSTGYTYQAQPCYTYRAQP